MENLGLEGLKQLGRQHWMRHRPKLFRKLRQSEDLESLLDQAAKSTLEAYQRIKKELQDQGYSPSQAHQSACELVREEWLLPPSEDQPDYEPPSPGVKRSDQSLDLNSLLDQKNPPRNIEISE